MAAVLERQRPKTGRPRRDIYAEVTERVSEALESGDVPWRKPWNVARMLPTRANGKRYRGLNVFLLSMTAASKGYRSPFWITYKQAQTFGGCVRKGEKGTLVIFWKVLDVERQKTDGSGETEAAHVPLLRHFTVFNAEQCDGLKLPPRLTVPERSPVEPSEGLAAILAGYADGPEVDHAVQDGAFYDPAADRVTLPPTDAFPNVDAYGGALLHELTHSTGHASRLDRFQKTGGPQHFGTERYAREELVAEMGAAILGVFAGIEPRYEQNAAYLRSWLRALADDPKLLVNAGAAAQKAVDRILGTTFDDGGTETGGEAE